MYVVSTDYRSLSQLIEKLTDGLPGTNTVSRVLAVVHECKVPEFLG